MEMEASFRWYGPDDQVPLSFIRQTGAEGVVTALHDLPPGAVWTPESIAARKRQVTEAGMFWHVVESLPVAEAVKIGEGDLSELFAAYRTSLRNLAQAGIRVVVYNFMPVLDWVRTNLAYRLPDGSEALFFNRAEFAAFEIYLLQRDGAEEDYDAATLARAKKFFGALTTADKAEFCAGIIDNFPGFKGMTLERVRKMLARYEHVDRQMLEANLARFLLAVAPTAQELGITLAIHPDDPPWPVLGLPRICSTAEDVERILKMCDLPSNGICFCAGSFSARPENDLPGMFRKFGGRVGFVHLRSTQHDEWGNFYEADHLAGSVDMPELVRLILLEQRRRREAGRRDWRIPMRPDHGHTMMDDLNKPACANPGYSLLGRMKGLAELRGLELGVARGLGQR